MTMERCAIFMASLATIAALVDAGCVGGGCGVDSTGEVMGAMKLADISDRTMDAWWGKFDVLWGAHKATLAADKDVLCKPEWKDVLKHLQVTKAQILLVESGLIALKDQLRMIRDILEGALGSKSGIHCKTDGTSAICIVLAQLDAKAEEKQKRLDAEKVQVDKEITMVENHNCDCKWPGWTGAWGECSPDCGPGTQTETREPLWEHRNAGKPCADIHATREQECTNGCCPVHCEWAIWETWGSCPKVCKKEQNFRQRIREIKVDGVCIERGGTACDNADANGKEECNIIAVMNKQIADKKVRIAALKALIELYKEKLCEPTPCLNSGKCFMGECHCAEGWTGTHCKERGVAEKPDPFKDMLKLFDDLDTNNDNELEKEEFLTEIPNILPPAAEDETSDLELWEILILADQDKNGKLSKEEWGEITIHDGDVDEQGRPVDEDGNLVNKDGKRIDEHGNLLKNARPDPLTSYGGMAIDWYGRWTRMMKRLGYLPK